MSVEELGILFIHYSGCVNGGFGPHFFGIYYNNFHNIRFINAPI